jgi:hypothetical protein
MDPWHFNNMCGGGEICNYQCQNPFFCPSCDGGNCGCVPVKKVGETCGAKPARCGQPAS